MFKHMQGRIPRAGIIRLGTPKGPNRPGQNTSYFRIETNQFEPDFLDAKLGKNPTQLRVKFPRIDRTDDRRSLEFIFDAAYKAYKNGQLFCKGDGESAMRAIKKGSLEQVTCTCELLTGVNPICKQRGDLKVALCDLPFLGYFAIGTSSWSSINSIQSVIDTYYQLLGEKFWITEFVLFKEEVLMQGRKQYIMRLKIARDFIASLPTGADVNVMMTFEEDGDDESDEVHEEPISARTEISEQKSSESAPPDLTPLVEAVSQVQESVIQALADPPIDVPDQVMVPDNQNASTTVTVKEIVDTVVEKAVQTLQIQDSSTIEVPDADPAPLAPVTSVEPPPPSATTPADPLPESPSPSATPASPSRTLTPQRRSKENRLMTTLKEFAKLGQFGDDANDICKLFAHGKTVEELSDDELQKTMADVYEAIKNLKNPELGDAPF